MTFQMRLLLIFFTLLTACFAPVLLDSRSLSILFEKLPQKTRSDVTKPSSVITPEIPVHEMALFQWKSRGGDVDVKKAKTKHKMIQQKIRLRRKRRAKTSRVKRVANGKVRQRLFCESTTIVNRALNCDAGSIIKVKNSTYGRRAGVNNPCKQPLFGRCAKVLDSTAIVAESCNGKQTCNRRFSYLDFGDPCRLAAKYSEVFWECLTPSWIKGPNKIYYINLFKPKKNMKTSRMLCEDVGGVLPKPKNPEENNFLKKFDETFFLGMNDIDEEGEWIWDTSRAPVQWFDWILWTQNPSEPNGGVSENCAVLWRGRGWSDKRCTYRVQLTTVICERNRTPNPNGTTKGSEDSEHGMVLGFDPIHLVIGLGVFSFACVLAIIYLCCYLRKINNQEETSESSSSVRSRRSKKSSNKSSKKSQASKASKLSSKPRRFSSDSEESSSSEEPVAKIKTRFDTFSRSPAHSEMSNRSKATIVDDLMKAAQTQKNIKDNISKRENVVKKETQTKKKPAAKTKYDRV